LEDAGDIQLRTPFLQRFFRWERSNFGNILRVEVLPGIEQKTGILYLEMMDG